MSHSEWALPVYYIPILSLSSTYLISLILSGVKLIEVRSRPIVSYLNHTVLLKCRNVLYGMVRFDSCRKFIVGSDHHKPFISSPDTHLAGGIVAASILSERYCSDDGSLSGPLYAWVIGAHLRLPEPIPVRTRMGARGWTRFWLCQNLFSDLPVGDRTTW